MLAIVALGGSLILVPQEDFWWHMKIGEWIQANGSIPTTGLYSATRADAPFFYQSWGSEWLFALFYRFGGLAGIVLVRNLLLVGSYGLLAWHIQRRVGGNGRAAMLGVLLAIVVAFDNWAMRPQTFSWLLFVLTFVIVSEVGAERWPRRALLALPLIQVAWVNLHGAFTLGPVLVGCAALGATIDRRRDHADAPTYPTARALWLALGGVLAAILVNPRGFGVVTYVIKLLTDPSSQKLVGEWASPFSTLDNPVTQLFFLVLVMTLIMVLTVLRKLRAGDLLALGAFTGLAITGIRYQIWFGMIAGAVTAEALVRRGRLRLIKGGDEASRFVAFLALGFGLAALLVQPIFRPLVPLPSDLRGSDGPLDHAEFAVSTTPIAAVEYLLQHPPSGPIFHDMRFSSYLIWRAGERLPVFVDTRVELYPIDMWFEYKCVTAGRDWEQLLAKYDMRTAMVNREIEKDLIAAMRASGVWTERYADKNTLVFERDPNAPPPPDTPVTCPAEQAAKTK